LSKSFHASHKLSPISLGIVPKRQVTPCWKKVRVFFSF
jgi:hypothetical protein